MPTPTAPTESASARPKSAAENIKETLESIVVAFILAFVFRAFIVEAFVIPTGSMAPTLYGQQVVNTCSTCGYEYAVGINVELMSHIKHELHCPNCETDPDRIEDEDIRRSNSGDRILVQKWPMNLPGDWLGPQRWDVTVFKDPSDGTTNFIKRLVGLPGEILEIIDGDVYTAPIERVRAERPDVLDRLEALGDRIYEYAQGPQDAVEREIWREYEEINNELLPFLRIERKSKAPRAQASLWFNVYDHDFLPSHDQAPESPVRWVPVDSAAAAAWNATEREMTFDAPRGEPSFIELAGKRIGDFYAYNNDGTSGGDGPGMYPIGDLRIRFTWFPDEGDGGLTLQMNRDLDLFTARIGVDGSVSVERENSEPSVPGGKRSIGEAKREAFPPGRAVRIAFMNVDYEVSLVVDGQVVVASNDEQYGPTLEKLRRVVGATLAGEAALAVKASNVRIGADGLKGRLRHVVLERDVYYRSQRQSEPRKSSHPVGQPTLPPEGGGRGGEPVNPFYEWRGWGTTGMPVVLHRTRIEDGVEVPAEYFMLGDNSPASKDSRLWWEVGPHLQPRGRTYRVGTVPEDQLIGKAFFVYWPAGYRPSWASWIGLIPNVGQMRWIR